MTKLYLILELSKLYLLPGSIFSEFKRRVIKHRSECNSTGPYPNLGFSMLYLLFKKFTNPPFYISQFHEIKGGKGKVKEGNSFDKSVQADRTEKMHGVTIWRVSRVPSLFPQPSFSVDLPHQKLLERQFTALQFEGSWS